MSLASWLFGCAKPPTYEAVLNGDIALAASDREAMDSLLVACDISPAELSLLPEDREYGADPYAKIENGRTTRLSLAGVTDTEGVGRLDHLRALRLSGSFPRLRLHGLESLAVLEVLSENESLRHLELSDLPELRSLSIHGADLPDNLDLSALALQTVSLTHCGLQSAPRFDPAALSELFLSGNQLASLDGLAGLDALERLHLSNVGLKRLIGLPDLPSLRGLYLSSNPLQSDVALDPDGFPELMSLDLSRTGLRAAPLGLRDRQDLRVQFEPEVAETLDFLDTLERLRQTHLEAPGDLVERVGATSGTIRGQKGRCTWKTGTHRRAEVSCRFTYESVRGTALVRLGETDPAMPFQGGGSPRVEATLTVGEGQVALYAKQEYDLIALAKVITGASEEVAEAARQSEDTFQGFRRVVARPGRPATVQGGVVMLGGHVALIVEALDDNGLGAEARDVTLLVGPQ
ncbi:MAG: hypothetical protein MPN21_13380 [Thermoanaerobaculia bacterium]|nr:hypothetical protein [Thermoanaerobaculia bacterium]